MLKTIPLVEDYYRDLKRIISEKFNVDFCNRFIAYLLNKQGLSLEEVVDELGELAAWKIGGYKCVSSINRNSYPEEDYYVVPIYWLGSNSLIVKNKHSKNIWEKEQLI